MGVTLLPIQWRCSMSLAVVLFRNLGREDNYRDTKTRKYQDNWPSYFLKKGW